MPTKRTEIWGNRVFLAIQLWVAEIRSLRGVAILGVVSIHITGYFNRIDHLNMLVAVTVALDVLSHFAVPLFIFVSAIALSVRYSGHFRRIAFYRRRLLTVIPPFIVFSTVFIVYSWLRTGAAPKAETVVFDYLTGDAYYHLWFIPLIVQFYLVFPYLAKAVEGHGKNKAIMTLSLAVALQVGYNVLCLEIPEIAEGEKASYLAGLSLLGYLAYFVAGIYVGHNLSAVRQWIRSVTILPYSLVVVVASGVVSLAWMDGIHRYGGFYEIPPSALVVPEVIAPLLCFTTILVVYRWWGFSGGRILGILGDYSLWIFLVHVLFIDAVRFALGFVGLTYESWPFYAITFIAVCTLCVASTAVLKRIPYSYILGGPRTLGTTDTPRAQ